MLQIPQETIGSSIVEGVRDTGRKLAPLGLILLFGTASLVLSESQKQVLGSGYVAKPLSEEGDSVNWWLCQGCIWTLAISLIPVKKAIASAMSSLRK